MLQRLRALPDVEAAALAVSIPLDIHGLPGIVCPRGTDASRRQLDRSLSNTVTPGYFAVMGIPMLAGQDFSELGNTSQPPQAIVNQAFVHQFIDSGEPLGRRIVIGDTTHTIVGVARTSVNDSFSEPPTPVVYLSYRDRPSRFGEMHLRTTLADESVVAPAVRRVIRELDESLPIFNVRTLTQQIDTSLALRRIPARMFIVLGPLILLLAATGIYAAVAYNVAQRTSEVGVRLALGASVGRILAQLVGETLRVVGLGVVAGWALVAYIYVRFLRGALDPMVFGGVPLLLVAVAAFACWAAARRATRSGSGHGAEGGVEVQGVQRKVRGAGRARGAKPHTVAARVAPLHASHPSHLHPCTSCTCSVSE